MPEKVLLPVAVSTRGCLEASTEFLCATTEANPRQSQFVRSIIVRLARINSLVRAPISVAMRVTTGDHRREK
jgi:hypothetical protein